MKGAFFITNCVNVEVRGPVRAYHNPAELPFTQGTIKEINNDKASGYNWVIQVHVSLQGALDVASRKIMDTARRGINSLFKAVVRSAKC